MEVLNLGILAHVDAGKTTLTERLLYEAGVIDELGSVDEGNTQTDSLALERQRGITIKSAVVSFVIGDVGVNLIDTPGHPDFIAEVERVLNVLDGVVLVVSAVEGVQPQTRILMRTLQRLSIPTLIFVNKIDRQGARYDGVLDEISRGLSPAIVALGSIRSAGSREATFELRCDLDRANLAATSRRAGAHPVFFGSARTGAGVPALMAAIPEFLPAETGDNDASASGSVFKIERGASGEKIAYVRMFAGTLRVRDRVPVGPSGEAKVTDIRVFDRGSAVRNRSLEARRIGKVWGLTEARIGDAIGAAPSTSTPEHYFAPPTLETVIVPRRPEDKGALHVHLTHLVEQDPLINLRQDDVLGELYLSVYGEVQKEVIQATLAVDFGIDVDFRESRPICVERPAGSGSALERLRDKRNPFVATVGLRVEPGAPGSGARFELDVGIDGIPIHVFKNVEAYAHLMETTVLSTLQVGLYGWAVTDCLVTMTDSEYTPSTIAAHFRKLIPLVLMTALKRAGTLVCQPVHHFRLEVPTDTLGAVLSLLGRLHATPGEPEVTGSVCVLEGQVAATQVDELQRQLPGLTHGEGVLEYAFAGYEPVHGSVPTRPRTDMNPLNRREYLRHVLRGK